MKYTSLEEAGLKPIKTLDDYFKLTPDEIRLRRSIARTQKAKHKEIIAKLFTK